MINFIWRERLCFCKHTLSNEEEKEFSELSKVANQKGHRNKGY
jgi:hypothetical protein